MKNRLPFIFLLTIGLLTILLVLPSCGGEETASVLDTDNDGVPDSEDLCKFDPGYNKFYGCPDTPSDRDKDGIFDTFDLCPDEPGLKSAKGCPSAPPCRNADGTFKDTDGDGINDCEDRCPRDKGMLSDNGCPKIDKSKDGERIAVKGLDDGSFIDDGSSTVTVVDDGSSDDTGDSTSDDGSSTGDTDTDEEVICDLHAAFKLPTTLVDINSPFEPLNKSTGAKNITWNYDGKSSPSPSYSFSTLGKKTIGLKISKEGCGEETAREQEIIVVVSKKELEKRFRDFKNNIMIYNYTGKTELESRIDSEKKKIKQILAKNNTAITIGGQTLTLNELEEELLVEADIFEGVSAFSVDKKSTGKCTAVTLQ